MNQLRTNTCSPILDDGSHLSSHEFLSAWNWILKRCDLKTVTATDISTVPQESLHDQKKCLLPSWFLNSSLDSVCGGVVAGGVATSTSCHGNGMSTFLPQTKTKKEENGFKDVGTGHVNKLTCAVTGQYLLQSCEHGSSLLSDVFFICKCLTHKLDIDFWRRLVADQPVLEYCNLLNKSQTMLSTPYRVMKSKLRHFNIFVSVSLFFFTVCSIKVYPNYFGHTIQFHL